MLITNTIKESTAQENVARVLKITKIENEDVYNMEVDKYHNFAVNGGLIVHNCMDCLRYICQDLPYDMSGNYSGPDTVDFFEKIGKIKDDIASFQDLSDYIKRQQKAMDQKNERKNKKKYAGGFKLC